jgi:hypothetical protein
MTSFFQGLGVIHSSYFLLPEVLYTMTFWITRCCHQSFGCWWLSHRIHYLENINCSFLRHTYSTYLHIYGLFVLFRTFSNFRVGCSILTNLVKYWLFVHVQTSEVAALHSSSNLVKVAVLVPSFIVSKNVCSTFASKPVGIEYWRLVIVNPFEILCIRFCSNVVRYLLFILVQIHTAVSKLLSIFNPGKRYAVRSCSVVMVYSLLISGKSSEKYCRLYFLFNSGEISTVLFALVQSC